ncbi:LuxR C-terminal-related transcriptional regulator [Cellulomonas sp. Y8]|uniref:helix-turn-helix transcriptional regulator n=1 Tax=Cellulomonas sp. Y8 TaxID=2591145 RepID=UPI003D70ACF2
MTDQIADGVAALAGRGTSVLLTGPAGSGRSHALRRVATQLDRSGRDVLRVDGVAGTPPLAAVRLALPGVLPGRGTEPVGFAGLHQALLEHLGDDDTVLVVDDGHLLDRESWGLLGAVHRRLGTPVVTSVVPGVPFVPWFVENVRPVVEVAIGGMSAEGLHAVLEERAQGPVPPQLSVRIHAETGGQPSLALAVFDEARRRGWEPGPVPDELLRSARVSGMHAAAVSGLPPEDRDAVELLGVVGPLPLRAALALLGGDRLSALERRGMLRAGRSGGEPTVAVAPPGLSDHLARATGETTRYRLVAAALDALDVGPGGEDDGLRTRLRGLLTAVGDGVAAPVPAGWAEDPGAGGAAVARLLATRVRIQLAEAARRWQDDPRTEHAAELLRLLLSVEDEPGRVDDVLARTDRTTDLDGFAPVELRYLEGRWAIVQGADPAAVAEGLVDGLPPGTTPAHREALDSLAVALRAEYGHVPDGYAATLGARVDGDDPAATAARVALAACHVIAGRHDDAAALLTGERGGWPALLRDSADVLSVLTRYGSGRLAEGVDRARALAGAAVDEGSPSTWVGGLYVAALCLGSRMRLDAARRELLPVLASGLRARALVVAPDLAARVLLATLSLHSQQTGLVQGLRALAEEHEAPADALPFGDALWVAAMSLFAGGEPEEGTRLLDLLTDRERGLGHQLAADATRIYRLLLSFDPGLATAFRGTAERIGGEAYLTYLDAQHALRDGRDPDALMAVARRFVALDMREQAVRCYLIAAGLLQVAGDDDGAARARADAQVLGSTPSVPLDEQAGSAELTEREREIAALIARGESTSAIARRLFLSRRTVESHLYNIRRKTGAKDRADIGRIVDPYA